MISRAQRPLVVLAALAAIVSSSLTAVAAVSLVNRDDKDHKLTVIEDSGAKSSDHILKPNQLLEGVCAAGCVVRLNDSEEDEFQLEAGDRVFIEEGYLYYEEPEGTQQGGATDGAAKPSAPAEAPKQ